MAYSTLDNLLALLPEETLIKLSNDEKGAEAIDTANVAAAIAQADSTIDGYVRVQPIKVPLDPVPENIRDISANLAVYYLYRRRNQIPEAWVNQYKIDIAVLTKIAAGQHALGGEVKPAAGPAQALTHSSKKQFGGSGGLLERY